MFVLESPCDSLQQRRQCNYGHVAFHHRNPSVSLIHDQHILELQEFFLLQIHLFQDDWGSNTIAAWVAVLYVLLPRFSSHIHVKCSPTVAHTYSLQPTACPLDLLVGFFPVRCSLFLCEARVLPCQRLRTGSIIVCFILCFRNSH